MQLGTRGQRHSSKHLAAAALLTLSFQCAIADSLPVFTDATGLGDQLVKDLDDLSQMSFIADDVFDMRLWGFDPKSGKAMAAWIQENVGFVLAYSQGPSVCYNLPTAKDFTKLGATRIDGQIVSLCSDALLSVDQGYGDFDIDADSRGYFYVAKGFGSMSTRGYGGGYVITTAKYLPFSSPDSGVFAYRDRASPPELVGEESRFLYRVANYLGDSLIKKHPTLTSCEGLTDGLAFQCDSSSDGVYALKGVALISLSRKCQDCSGSERAFMQGVGLDYLFSMPYGSRWNLTGAAYLRRMGPNLKSSGIDTVQLKKKLQIGMTKAG